MGFENVNYALVGWGPRSADYQLAKENYWQPGFERPCNSIRFNYTFFDNPFFTLLEIPTLFNRDRVFGNIKLQTTKFTRHLKARHTIQGWIILSEVRQLRRKI